MRESQNLRPDLREQLALDVIAACPFWHVEVKTRGDQIIGVTFQASRPSSRVFSKGAELFELEWHAGGAVGIADKCRLTDSYWHWSSEDRWTAALPATSARVREEFVRRASRATADDERTDHEAALRDRALRLVAGESISPVDPDLQAALIARLRAQMSATA